MRLGSRVRETPWTLPADFVVPDAFPDAVRALERLTAAAAMPLFGTDSLGGQRRTEGFAVSVAESRAEGLIAAAQQRFFDKGFYLFRSQQNFGVRGQPDHVALFPRSDPYEILHEILRLMGTNGWNYDIGPDSIVAWLRALERDHPFVLTGMGFDWVEGRFRSAIGDAGALARRVYAFCCWWD